VAVYRGIYLSEICLFYILQNTTYFSPNFFAVHSEYLYICAYLISENMISKTEKHWCSCDKDTFHLISRYIVDTGSISIYLNKVGTLLLAWRSEYRLRRLLAVRPVKSCLNNGWSTLIGCLLIYMSTSAMYMEEVTTIRRNSGDQSNLYTPSIGCL
jgi:hypothetical protein